MQTLILAQPPSPPLNNTITNYLILNNSALTPATMIGWSVSMLWPAKVYIKFGY